MAAGLSWPSFQESEKYWIGGREKFVGRGLMAAGLLL
jgi:hypothetical protein